MAATIVGAFQPEMRDLITDSKLLLVGTGGIGCEVLKDLVLTGFGEIEVIDLDTIEVSNLNRQFLFNKDSVGKPKSLVARESVLNFNPNVNIKAHVGDIMDQKYNTKFFSEFKLVINALDNKKARNHVNRMCLACDIPLIESGTMGYNGQVEFIKKGLSSCYECSPKAEPKSYPMCTIRNTPKEPIHCITWAKFLFGQLFGPSQLMGEDVSMEEVDTTTDNRAKVSARVWAKNNDYDPKKLFKKIFIDDINYLLKMPVLFINKIIEPIVLAESIVNERSDYLHEPDTKVLNFNQYITMFLDSVKNIKEKFTKSNDSLIWDKDDDDFMNFVVACSNIRSEIFHIPFKSHFDIKSMAGNIIPAIATANAIIAGQIVIHALRVLKGDYEHCQTVYLRELPNHKGVILNKDRKLQKPNPKCSTCTSEDTLILSTNLHRFTLQQLEDLVLKNKLNMVQPDVIFNCNILISSDEDDKLDLSKTLSDMKVDHGSRISADDYHQNYSVKIMLHHKEKLEEEDPDFVVYCNLDDMKAKIKESRAEKIKKPEEDNDCILEDEEMEKVGKVDKMEVESVQEINDDKAVVVHKEPDVSSEEMLALKRKAGEDGDISEPKKSRVD